MREKILACLLFLALCVIGYDHIILHSASVKAAGKKLVHVQPTMMTYPYPAKLAVGEVILGFSCIGSVAPGEVTRVSGTGPGAPECFILVSDE